MDVRSRMLIRWALAISGVAGVICAGAMLLVTLVEYGKSDAALSVATQLETLARGAPPAGVAMLVVGFVCALLLVAGGWPVKTCAGLAVAWFVYAQGAFGPDGRWARQMADSFDMTPFYVGAMVSTVALLAVSVLALVVAVRMTGPLRVESDAVRL